MKFSYPEHQDINIRYCVHFIIIQKMDASNDRIQFQFQK